MSNGFLEDLNPTREDLMTALRETVAACHESLALQSHYATLLNSYDGGNRQTFTSVVEWIARLKESRGSDWPRISDSPVNQTPE